MPKRVRKSIRGKKSVFWQKFKHLIGINANSTILEVMPILSQFKGKGGTLYNMRILLGKPALSLIPANRSRRVLRRISYLRLDRLD